jgi:hypothetical protein
VVKIYLKKENIKSMGIKIRRILVDFHKYKPAFVKNASLKIYMTKAFFFSFSRKKEASYNFFLGEFFGEGSCIFGIYVKFCVFDTHKPLIA